MAMYAELNNISKSAANILLALPFVVANETFDNGFF